MFVVIIESTRTNERMFSSFSTREAADSHAFYASQVYAPRFTVEVQECISIGVRVRTDNDLRATKVA